MVALTFFCLAAMVGASVAQNSTNLRYMPFGDSITEIICWRAKLWEKMQSTEFAKVDWVGSGKTENNCKDTKYDRDNEGHSGFLAIDIANKKQLVGWLQKNPADVITMHLGTNDIVQQSKPTADILKAFTTLIGVMRDSNPKMKIVVSVAFVGKRCCGADIDADGCTSRSLKLFLWAWAATTARSRISIRLLFPGRRE
jgi:lysophospholipase L1-like esterase